MLSRRVLLGSRTVFPIPDFALGVLVSAILMTLAVISASPSNFDNFALWMLPLAGVAIAVAGGVPWNSQRLAIATLLVLALTGYLIAMQFFAIRTQIGEMRSEQRAWVSITSIKIVGAARNINGISLTFQYSVDNSGRNPAANVFLTAKLYMATVATGTTLGNIGVEGQLCRSPFVHDYSSFSLFPGQQKQGLNTTWTLPQADIDRFEKSVGKRVGSIPIFCSGLLGLQGRSYSNLAWNTRGLFDRKV